MENTQERYRNGSCTRVALLKSPRPLAPWSSWILKPQTEHEEEEVQREECNEEHSARNTSQVSTLFLAVVLPLYTVCVDGGEAVSFWHDKIVGRPVTLHAPQWAHTVVELGQQDSYRPTQITWPGAASSGRPGSIEHL